MGLFLELHLGLAATGGSNWYEHGTIDVKTMLMMMIDDLYETQHSLTMRVQKGFLCHKVQEPTLMNVRQGIIIIIEEQLWLMVHTLKTILKEISSKNQVP